MTILIKKIGLESKSQWLKFDKIFEIIDDVYGIGNDWNPKDKTVKKEMIGNKYFEKEFWAEFVTRSRIDAAPVFIIDTLQLDREDKISQVLK